MQPTPQTVGPQTHLLCRGNAINSLLDHRLTSALYTWRNFADACRDQTLNFPPVDF